MTEQPAGNVAASVRQRLLNLRDAQGGDYNTLLTQFAIERFLYRISKSELADAFDESHALRHVDAIISRVLDLV